MLKYIFFLLSFCAECAALGVRGPSAECDDDNSGYMLRSGKNRIRFERERMYNESACVADCTFHQLNINLSPIDTVRCVALFQIRSLFLLRRFASNARYSLEQSAAARFAARALHSRAAVH